MLILVSCSLPLHARQTLAKKDSLLKKLQVAAEDTSRVTILVQLAASYARFNTDSVIFFADSAKKLSERLHYAKGIADALRYISNGHRYKGDYPVALNLLLRALKIYDSLGLQRPYADLHLNIAQVFKDMAGNVRTKDLIDKGIEYSKISYNLFSRQKDTAGMIDALNMAGLLYRDNGVTSSKTNYDTAYQHYTRAIALYEKSGKGKEHLPKIYNNISHIFTEYKKDYKTALDYLFKAVEYNKGNNTSLSYNYGNIAETYVHLKENKKSLDYAKKMLDVAQQSNIATRIHDAYNQLYRSFLANKLPDSALRYYQLADYLDDSLTNLAKTNQVMDLQTKYETREKEAEIEKLNIEGSSKNKQILLLAISLLVLIVLAGSMIWLYRRVRQQRQQIMAQSTRLEVMMKELHHRVKNNLQIVSSLLSLQTYKMTDAGAISVLRESQQRVQAMSFIHQRLYKKETLTAVNMKEYLTDLAESLLSSYGYNRDNFDLHLQVEKEMMDVDKALPIGLIINEMVTNALKYAYQSIHRPCLHITLTEDKDGLHFSVKDNGIGINETAWKEKNNSFGKQLITALCKQLRARQTLVVDGGTQFRVVIPKQVA